MMVATEVLDFPIGSSRLALSRKGLSVSQAGQ